MKIDLYDKGQLKTGETASIVELWEDGKAYEVDIDRDDGSIETDTIFIGDIQKVL